MVEAAGNGTYDLDTLTWVGDSGAIIVGGGNTQAANDRTIAWYSSYGSRVDMQGWGVGCYTTGYGTLYNAGGANYWYTSGFNGTSSSSATIAGVVTCLNGYWKANFGVPCPPDLARVILTSTGRPQVTPPAGNIGPRPNLAAACVAGLDSDADGMPNEWEVQNSLSPTNAADRTTDADGDGASNFDEYVADTLPQESNSVFRILAVSNNSPSSVSFSSSVARTYSLLRSTNLLGSNWTAIATNVSGTGGMRNITDTNPPPTSFYRLQTRHP